MAVGLSAVNNANKYLALLHRGVAWTPPAGNYLATHIGDPGSAGTANASGTTTRMQVTWATESGGSISSNNTPTWTSWAGGSQTLSHLSEWDVVTAGSGNFLESYALTTSKAIANGDTFTVTTLTHSQAPIAA